VGSGRAGIAAISDGLAIAHTGMLSPRISNLGQAEKVQWLIKKFVAVTRKIAFIELIVAGIP